MALNSLSLTAQMRDWWSSRSAEQRANFIRAFSVSIVISLLVGFYYLNYEPEVAVETAVGVTSIEPVDLLQRDLQEQIDQAVAKAINEHLGRGGDQQDVAEVGNQPTGKPTEEVDELESLNFTPRDSVTYPREKPISTTQVDAELSLEEPKMLGGINTETVSNTQLEEQIQTQSPVTPKYPIPPGFMPAKMLVGVHAQVSSGGSGSPKPVHLRVQAPATLPNEIKLNLEGCFVIANTWGNLASERIEAELVSIHCITKDRQIIIEGDLKGYVADPDGQRDIAGRVVTKAGALLSRQFVADVMAGIGDSISTHNNNSVITATGIQTTLDAGETAQKGLARGIGMGFKGTADFISNLLSQSTPVIESGAAKDVMLMVQETSWLEIKDIKSTASYGIQ
jgi:conjugal transfer pilus assembly protein TraB